MNHFLNTGTWGINCRKDLRSHASFLETKILKADFSNEIHGALPDFGNLLGLFWFGSCFSYLSGINLLV